jgi:hypothetical protein
LLRATHGNDHLGVAANENGGVENAVLFGAGEFLAVEEEHGRGAGVDDAKFGDGAGFGQFGDGEVAAVERLVQSKVIGTAVILAVEGVDSDVTIGLGRAGSDGPEVTGVQGPRVREGCVGHGGIMHGGV